MRPKVVVATLLLALGIFGAAWFISRSARQTTATPATVAAAPQTAANATAANVVPPASSPAPALITTSNAPTSPVADIETPTNHDLYVFDRKAELMQQAMTGGPDALNNIWPALSDPDKEIRNGALAALVQLGDQSVSPRLRDLAAQTEDAQEKLDILAAADQLDLPPLGRKQTNQ